MAKQVKGYRIQFTLSKGKRGEVTLSGKTDKIVAAEFRRLVQALAAYHREGVSISQRDKRSIENLPTVLREKLIDHKLIEGKPEEVVPTLAEFIRFYKNVRSGKSGASHWRDERLCRYLAEYFPANKRIDTFVKTDAELFKNYLTTDRSVGRGCITQESANKFIQQLKSFFRVAVDAEHLTKSPFASVKAGNTVNKKRQEYISGSRIQEAIDSIEVLELKAFLAFTRFGGIRPHELQHLRWLDFEFFDNGYARFRIPQGKTGERFVPISRALRPMVDTLFSNTGVGQERLVTNPNYILSEKYRRCTAGGIGVEIRRELRKAGLQVWGKLFINLRSSLITDLRGKGLSVLQKDCIVGNSEKIRNDHYEQLNMPDEEYAGLGELMLPKDWEGAKEGKVPSHFPSFDLTYWESFDDNTPNLDLALKLCERAGLPTDESRKMLEKDGRMEVFGKSVKALRHSIYDYAQGRISYVGILLQVFAFLSRAIYEFVREMVVTPCPQRCLKWRITDLNR